MKKKTKILGYAYKFPDEDFNDMLSDSGLFKTKGKAEVEANYIKERWEDTTNYKIYQILVEDVT